MAHSMIPLSDTWLEKEGDAPKHTQTLHVCLLGEDAEAGRSSCYNLSIPGCLLHESGQPPPLPPLQEDPSMGLAYNSYLTVSLILSLHVFLFFLSFLVFRIGTQDSLCAQHGFTP